MIFQFDEDPRILNEKKYDENNKKDGYYRMDIETENNGISLWNNNHITWNFIPEEVTEIGI